MPIKVVVADDHEVVRKGLATLLKGTEINVVGEAANGKEAITESARLNPHVLVMDIRMPELDGLEALEQMRNKGMKTKVLVLSTYDNPTYMARAAALGAVDYVLKGVSRQKLVAAIDRVAKGEDLPSDSQMVNVKSAMAKRREPSDQESPLTNREMQVLRHVALGLSNREISHSLQISIETVKEHVQNILRKLNVNDRTQAAVWAVKQKFV